MNSLTRDELTEIIEDYSSIPTFISEYNLSTAPEFDYFVVNKMSLFLVHENYDFESLEAMLGKIDDALPAIKRIFVKPIIHLKEEDEVLPVEAVRLVNNSTIVHIASHSELWNDFDENTIQPLKLLTRTYRDNYSIYENVLFARTINCILSYLRKNMRMLRAMMYTSEMLEFNLLERLNHLNYYLAIGKLHTGYIRDFGKYYDEARTEYKRMENLYGAISARLKRNVYKYNKNFKGEFHLHNSNILHMQKDYHKTYMLYKHFNKVHEVPREIKKEEFLEFQGQYMDYVLLITIFSILNFNFEMDKEEKLDLIHPDMNFSYNSFNLHVSKNEQGSLILDFKKEKEYRIILAPSWDKENYECEVIYITPFTTEGNLKLISITDVESFRRIQQVLYQGMVYSDISFDSCAFCGKPMKQISQEGDPLVCLCSSCNAKIEQKKCSKSLESYYVTSIYGIHPDFSEGDKSKQLHYRNITDFFSTGEEKCPCCHKVFED